ncbi:MULTISPECIES: hypothetical protein [Sinorhizobium]|nr:hypothetical protein [Sinorhizobium meliloti]
MQSEAAVAVLLAAGYTPWLLIAIACLGNVLAREFSDLERGAGSW